MGAFGMFRHNPGGLLIQHMDNALGPAINNRVQ